MSFALDAHTHTSRFSFCSTIAPEQLLREAVRVDLDGVVLTEHGRFWPDEELGNLRSKFPEISIFNGAEMDIGTLHHVLVFIPEPSGGEVVPEQPKSFLSWLSDRDGFACSAHPYRFFERYQERNSDWSLPGVEVASGNMNRSGEVTKSRELSEQWLATPLASSDAHSLEPVGNFYTRLPRQPETEAELVKILREAETEPVYPTPAEYPSRL